MDPKYNYFNRVLMPDCDRMDAIELDDDAYAEALLQEFTEKAIKFAQEFEDHNPSEGKVSDAS